MICVVSCGTVKPSSYFSQITRDTVFTISQSAKEELKIKKGDVLSIIISSLSKTEDDLFNITGAAAGKSALSGYQVGNEGELYLHKLGKVVVEGLTRKEVKSKLEQLLQPFLKDPIVAVNFDNHFITVIGEIGKPQLLQMPQEKISIIDVLAQSGNSSPTTLLTNVLLIRETGDKRELRHLNLEDQSIFNSPFYYLLPNDIVVLKPNEKKLDAEEKRQKYQQISGLVLQAVTLSLVIYQTFFRN